MMEGAKAPDSSSSHASTPRANQSSAEEFGTPTDGSQTSPSLSEANDILARPKVLESKISSEASHFLSDLSNFLALGCLVVERGVADGSPEYDEGGNLVWHDIVPEDENLCRLATAGWIRAQHCQSVADPRYTIYRIYILPGDVGLRFFDRQSRRLQASLEAIIAKIDVSSETWSGSYASGQHVGFDQWAKSDEGSLFYMFNKLPSPRPDPSVVKEKYTREALEDLLDPSSALVGLKTPLYPYQRRSAALMLQRESVPTLQLDPRLELRSAPDGSQFYYGARDLQFVRNPRYYESSRGGILAETMGLGKTLMCLALILATRNHLPKVPAAYGIPPVRAEVASLADMAVSAINRKSVPWKVEFERIAHATQEDMGSCVERLQRDLPGYEIPVEPVRWNRKTVIPPPLKKTLAATTLIVVPRNLCKQWHSEIHKHVDEGILRILLMEDSKSVLPPARELREYDVVLFSRTRFEMEVKDGSDDQGRRMVSRPPSCNCPYIGATRTVDCHCVKMDDLYESPLKHLHFKRLIIDEGHFFSSSNTTAVTVAKKLVTADHRWVVSGTPAKDLLGVEADMSVAQDAAPDGLQGSRDAVLDQRRHFNVKEDTTGAIKSLGTLASNFLRIRPWAAEDLGERPAVWEEHIYRHEGHRRRTFSGFSSCLRRTLEAMVVKTQPEDVEQDIDLPPLTHEVIRLQPSFYDKLTANLFTIVLTANAVTSERTDADYLFHKNSAQARYQLIGNLRQSAFFWTGFSEEDIEAFRKNSRGYLDKEGTSCSVEDRQLLEEALKASEAILSSNGWKALSRSHELGLFVDRWPAESADFWSFCGNVSPLLTGITQLLEAQRHVNERIGLDDPGEGLAGVGIRSLRRAQEGHREDQVVKKEAKPTLSKAGISLSGEPTLKRRSSASSVTTKSPTKQPKTKQTKRKWDKEKKAAVKVETDPDDPPTTYTNPSVPTPKRRLSDLRHSTLPATSPFNPTTITGTTSAKLSYLASQILRHHSTEKILVFYEGDNIAYYVAQTLELLHIPHEIYAKSLPAALKAEYVVRFNEQAAQRVLLMDVRHAAFGLNISAASRIFFVNPVCRPNVEAQAIKRAHRIGQTRPVRVETLVLAGTVEERMYERARRMTNVEHQGVSHLEDDRGMREIIQGARLIEVREGEGVGQGQMAPLEVPQRLWGREGWWDMLELGTKGVQQQRGGKRVRAGTPGGQADGGLEEQPQRKKRKKTVRVVTPQLQPGPDAASAAPSTARSTDGPGPVMAGASGASGEDDEDEPMMHRWQRRLSQGMERLMSDKSQGTQNLTRQELDSTNGATEQGRGLHPEYARPLSVNELLN
ncbi:hypothetical protein WHR41_06125 [Cladosporium halotolerans]|uniref:Helicase C-terminal domain-containing protein n=1 Tax=Cladosporium halotolerans TaxID=1052096 RepID=A0AB34KIU1_9PEZI